VPEFAKKKWEKKYIKRFCESHAKPGEKANPKPNRTDPNQSKELVSAFAMHWGPCHHTI